MLARLSPHEFSLASPQAVRGAICRHFAPSFVLHAVEGLASRKPEQSARTRMASWQRLAFCFVPLALLTALALAPVETLWGVTASSRSPVRAADRISTACGPRPVRIAERRRRSVESARAGSRASHLHAARAALSRGAYAASARRGRSRGSTIRRRSSTSKLFSRRATARRSPRRARSGFPACSSSSSCRSLSRAPSRRRSTTRCRSRAANIL